MNMAAGEPPDGADAKPQPAFDYPPADFATPTSAPVTRPRSFRLAMVLMCLAGTLLRLDLAWVNREANDDHLAVAKVMAYQDRIPDKEELSEAFQPKLYHGTVAAILRLLPPPPPVRTRWFHHRRVVRPRLIETRVAQLVSCAAGILTMLVFLRFLQVTDVSGKARLLAMAFVAFNPRLVGINGQATNDSFVILFGSLALYFGARFFSRATRRDFTWMTVAALLAAVSKGNGLVICILIVLVFLVALLLGLPRSPLSRPDAARYGAMFLVAFFVCVPKLGGYWDHYLRYGSPFVINIEPAPWPNWFEPTFVRRPGVVSIADALLTFRFIDMLEHPVITTEEEDYPIHRQSLWSELYGRTHFGRFTAWPPSWESRTPLVLNCGRLLFVLALLPTALLLMGMARASIGALRWMIGGDHSDTWRDRFLGLSALAYVPFTVIYVLRFRDYACMKAIFLFPALCGFLLLFARQCDRYYAWCARWRAVCLLSDVIFTGLFVAYVADIVMLIAQLRGNPL